MAVLLVQLGNKIILSSVFPDYWNAAVVTPVTTPIK